MANGLTSTRARICRGWAMETMARRCTDFGWYAATVQAVSPPQSWPTTVALASPSARISPAMSAAAVIRS